MLHVYWGGENSGKSHLVKYATLNSKSLLKFKQYQIIRQDFNCRQYDFDVNDRLWWDVEEKRSIYYKRWDTDTISVSKHTEYNFGPTHYVTILNNYCTPGREYDRIVEWKSNKLGMFKPEHYEKFSGKEYIDSVVYHKILSTNHERLKRNIDKIVRHKDKFDIDEISENTDLLFLFAHIHHDDDFTDDTLYYANHFKNAKHIVPYKEDLVDSFACKLDGVADEARYLVGRNLMEVALNDREKLWEYLDSYLDYDKKIIKLLESLKIDYVKFNLDSNAYVETFGWDKYPFKKDLTHISDTFTDQKQFDRWEDCVRLAKAYIHDRKL